MIVATSPTSERTIPIYVTTSSVVWSSAGGGVFSVLADISYEKWELIKDH